MSGSKKMKKAAAEVERLKAELAKAQAAVGKTDSGSGKKGKKKKRGKLKLLVLAAIGALVVSEDLRGKVLDALFGAEEEFQYTPPAPAGEGPAAA
jgi:hypothetical protein